MRGANIIQSKYCKHKKEKERVGIYTYVTAAATHIMSRCKKGKIRFNVV